MIKYIAGNNFTSEFGQHLKGEEVPVEQAESFPLLESLVHTGYIYPIVSNDDYAKLPPHLVAYLKPASVLDDPNHPTFGDPHAGAFVGVVAEPKRGRAKEKPSA